MAPRPARAVAAAWSAAAAVLAAAAPVAATVSVDQQSAVHGSQATVVFNVRTDRPGVSTTGLDITFPAGHVLTDVLTQPKPGWAVTVERAAAPASADGSGAGGPQGVSKVRWSVTSGPAAIGPDQFDLFSLSIGGLPAGVDRLVFQAVQTYSDGQTAAWAEGTLTDSTGGSRPSAPVLLLEAAPAPPAPAAPAAPASPAPVEAAAAPQPDATPLAVDLAAASEPEVSRAERVAFGLVLGVGLILLGVLATAPARRRERATPAPPA